MIIEVKSCEGFLNKPSQYKTNINYCSELVSKVIKLQRLF